MVSCSVSGGNEQTKKKHDFFCPVNSCKYKQLMWMRTRRVRAELLTPPTDWMPMPIKMPTTRRRSTKRCETLCVVIIELLSPFWHPTTLFLFQCISRRYPHSGVAYATERQQSSSSVCFVFSPRSCAAREMLNVNRSQYPRSHVCARTNGQVNNKYTSDATGGRIAHNEK